MLKDKPRWCLPLPSICLPLIKRHKGRVYDVTHCFILEKKMRSSILIKCLVSVFLHINYVPSSIYNEVGRFTNERLSTSIEAIGLPRRARALLTLIGSCRIYSVFHIKRVDFESAIFLAIALLRKKSYYHQYSLKHCSKHASRIERFISIDDWWSG